MPILKLAASENAHEIRMHPYNSPMSATAKRIFDLFLLYSPTAKGIQKGQRKKAKKRKIKARMES